MGRSPCCDKVGLKKGPWTPEEDQKLLAYIEEHGHGSWRALPVKAGLQRCGKSCRLRWTNYLRPDIKRGKFSLQEEQTIIQLHALLGNRWSAIATHLPKRTDNEIKNYWNTHLKKRLAKMGIDPVTHKPKNDTLLSSDGQSKNAANLSHMAQWESARLEAEARLVRESKLRSKTLNHQLESASISSKLMNKAVMPSQPPLSLDIFKAWQGVWSKSTDGSSEGCTGVLPAQASEHLESPTSTLSSTGMVEFINPGSSDASMMKEEKEDEWKNPPRFLEYKDGLDNSVSFTSGLQEMGMPLEGAWSPDSLRTESNEHEQVGNFIDGFTELLLGNNNSGDPSNEDANNPCGSGSEYDEENKNYWNSILNLVNSSPSDSAMF